MNAWRMMKRDLYIGGDGGTDRIDRSGGNLSVVSDMDILSNGEWILQYSLATEELILKKRSSSGTFTAYTIKVKKGTELKNLMLDGVTISPNTSKPNQPFRDVYSLGNTKNANHVVLTNYGDLLILNALRWDTKIFWSAFRQNLIDRGLVYSQYPNYGRTDYEKDEKKINDSLRVGGNKFNPSDSKTWAFNVVNNNKGYDRGYTTISDHPLLPGNYIYGDVGTGYWVNALYFTGGDLLMFTYNRSKLRSDASPVTDLQTNRATVSWRLTEILKKVGDTTSLSGAQYLMLKGENLILSGGGTSVIYTLASGVGRAKYLAINTIGDMILLDSDDVPVWSFFGWLLEKIITKENNDASKAKTDIENRRLQASDTMDLVQPTLTDKNKSYGIAIYSADLSKCGTSNISVTGWFVKLLKDKKVKTTNDLKNIDIWSKTFSDFGCKSTDKPSIKIKWTFNGTEKEKTFKDPDKIDLTFTTSCVGGYDVCRDGKQKWVKTYDPYPSGSCDAKGDISCVASTPPPTSDSASTTTPPPSSDSTTTSNVDCVASWSEFGDCVDGQKTKTYTVTTSSSGSGKECETFDGDTKTEDCSGAWYTNPLILGGIAGGILLLFIIIMMTMSSKSSE